jgi:hypothetical protein
MVDDRAMGCFTSAGIRGFALNPRRASGIAAFPKIRRARATAPGLCPFLFGRVIQNVRRQRVDGAEDFPGLLHGFHIQPVLPTKQDDHLHAIE